MKYLENGDNMGYVQARPNFESKTIKCPFCKMGDIDICITSEFMSAHSSHAAGRRSKIPIYHPEKIEVFSKCPNCDKSKKEIKESIERGATKEVSHEERLKRLKDSGLPTKIEY